MKKVALALALGAAVAAAPALAQAAAPAEKPASGLVTLTELKLTATVEAIDVAKRLLTVKGPAGNVQTFEVDATVENLSQVEVGDSIELVYHESLLWEVRAAKSAAAGVAASGGVVKAEPGEKPGLAARRQITATVTITAVDLQVPSVSFRGPSGDERTIMVLHPEKLATVKVGDEVDILYTEALAIAVAKAPAAK